MFESTLCARAITKVPLSIPWWKFPWLKNFLLLILIPLVLFLLFWAFQYARKRHWLSNPRVLLFLFCFTAGLPLLSIGVDRAIVALLPHDSSEVANAIVLLGRGGGEFFEHRVKLATELWQAKRAPLIFTSGDVDAGSMLEQFRARGIPETSLDGEDCSLTTWENAVFTAAVLQPQGMQKIILITDEPHMWRSLLVYRALGFSVIPRTTPVPSYMNFREKGFLRFREYMGTLDYAFRGLFFPQTLAKLTDSDLGQKIREAEEYAKQRERITKENELQKIPETQSPPEQASKTPQDG
jgi:uncharacterized SAM-binding protein YcdF (DUF218 family)